MKRAFLLLLVMYMTRLLVAQSQDFLPHFDGQHSIDKKSVTSGQLFFSHFRPVSRQKAANLYLFDSTHISKSSAVYRAANEYFFVTDEKKGLLGKFYKNEIDFFQVDEEDFTLRINPVWQFQVGNDPAVDNLLFINSRGLDVRGTIDKRVSFHTRFLENQIEHPYYIKRIADTTGIVPYEGFWKEYNETTTDFLRAFGSVSINVSPHISAQLGYGRQFIGNGIRSLLLSDYANSYPYVKIDSEIWKIRYTNLFATLIADAFIYDQGTLGASRYPKKFMSAHYLDWAVTSNFHIGLFESIIFGQPDSVASRQFQLEYLNPIIFYRTVEQQDGSAANALLGATFQWNIKKRYMLYGQFLLDELIVSELTAGNSWWGNKYSYQLGLQGYDLLTENLDLKVEYNMSRPYTYSHQDFYTSYTHYRHPLAHPMGANFREVVGQIIFKPLERLTFTGHGVIAAYGQDIDEFSAGKDPHRSYNDRPAEYGINQLQGNRGDLRLFQLRSSYYWKYNLNVDLTFIYRSEKFENEGPDQQSTIISAGFRWNMPVRNYLF